MDETARIINKSSTTKVQQQKFNNKRSTTNVQQQTFNNNVQKFNNKSTTTTPEKDEHTTGRNRKK